MSASDWLRKRHRAVSARVQEARARPGGIDPARLGDLLVELAELRTELGLPREAQTLLDEAIAVTGETASRALLERIDYVRLSLHLRLAEELGDLNETAQSDAALLRAQEIAQRLKAGEALGRISFDLGCSRFGENRFKEALVLFSDSRERFRQAGSEEGQAYAAIALGAAHHRLDEPVDACALFREAAALYEALGSRTQVLECRGWLGDICLEMGETAEARECYEDVLAGARESGDAAGELEALHSLGNTHREADQWFAAALRFEELLSKLPPNDAPALRRALVHYRIGECRSALLSVDAAENHFRLSAAEYDAAGSHSGAATAFYALASLLALRGKHAEAADAHARRAAHLRLAGERVEAARAWAASIGERTRAVLSRKR